MVNNRVLRNVDEQSESWDISPEIPVAPAIDGVVKEVHGMFGPIDFGINSIKDESRDVNIKLPKHIDQATSGVLYAV